MTQDEIIEMARQAGFGLRYEGRGQISSAPTTTEKLEAFAKLVAAKERDRMCKQCNWSKHENAACNEANQSKILGEG